MKSKSVSNRPSASRSTALFRDKTRTVVLVMVGALLLASVIDRLVVASVSACVSITSDVVQLNRGHGHPSGHEVLFFRYQKIYQDKNEHV